jgi:prepilin-type N-terminal cleavage/methylation domain-containing protein
MISLKNKKGFTLIELVIVLAIAALIILVVLQAVGAAQKSQRDNARKNKAAQIESYLTEYASNTGNGSVPATLTTAWASSPLASYDTTANSLTSYSFKTGPAYATSGWNPAATCTATPDTTSTTTVVYTANAAATDYDLGVCLEAGGYSVLKGN